jgi:hypothetical protein
MVLTRIENCNDYLLVKKLHSLGHDSIQTRKECIEQLKGLKVYVIDTDFVKKERDEKKKRSLVLESISSLTPVEKVNTCRLRAECDSLGLVESIVPRCDLITALKIKNINEIDLNMPPKPKLKDKRYIPKSDPTNVFIGNCAGYYETSSNKLHISNQSTNAPLIGGDFIRKTVNINECLNLGNTYMEIGPQIRGKVGDMRRNGPNIFMYREGDGVHSGWYPISFGSVVII